MKVVCYFFATPLIDYTKLIEQQAMVQSPDAYMRNVKKR